MEKNEEKLISDILAGEADVYAVLVRRYEKPIFNLMLRMTSSEADAVDLTQETFVRAYEKLDRFKSSGRFFPWLYTIGLNLARDHLRKTKTAKNLENELQGPNNPFYQDSGQEHDLLENLNVEKVGMALKQLPSEYREAVFLRFHEGMAMKEIAQALQISVSGAKMRVHRGLLKLRQLLQKERRDDE
jgi:RNA polymerase sigma-70 factor (ECF subfamily)